MDNTNQCEDLIENIVNDDYIVVTENNSDEDEDTEINWIKVGFSENDLEEYKKQSDLSHESNVNSIYPDEILPSRWEIIKKQAPKFARTAVEVPVTLAVGVIVLPVAVPMMVGLMVGGLAFGFMLDDPNGWLSKWVQARNSPRRSI